MKVEESLGYLVDSNLDSRVWLCLKKPNQKEYKEEKEEEGRRRDKGKERRRNESRQEENGRKKRCRGGKKAGDVTAVGNLLKGIQVLDSIPNTTHRRQSKFAELSTFSVY